MRYRASLLPLLAVGVQLLVFGAGSAPAATGDPVAADTTIHKLGQEVLVTATRLNVPLRQNPGATSVVSSDELKTMPRGVAINEALRSVPGVRIDQQANDSRIHLSIRGQGILSERGVRGVKVLLDGLPLNDPTGVAPDLYDVDWSAVNRVEVLRGPMASLYGGGGAGGVVNISTPLGAPKELSGNFTTSAGSNGFWKSHLDAAGTRDQVSYLVSASRAAGSGYRVHTGFWGDNAYEKIGWSPSASVHVTQVLGWTNYWDENAEGLPKDVALATPEVPNPDALTFNEYYKTNRTIAGLVGQVQVTPDQDLQCSAFYRTTQYRESVPSSVQHRTFYTPGLSAQYTLRSTLSGTTRNHLSVGTDLQWQNIDDYRLMNMGYATEDTLLSNETIAQRGLAVFLLDRLEIGEQWGVVLGARYDDIRNELADLMAGNPVNLSGNANFHRATARVGLAYTPKPEINLFANWGQGFLPPTTEELVNNPAQQGGFNQGLTFATSNGMELGARGVLGEKLVYDLTGFYLSTENDFNRYRMEDRPLETFYRNLGTSHRYGIEAALRVQPLKGLDAEVAYTYSRFKYTGSDSLGGVALDGQWLPNSPQHMLNAEVEYEVMPGLHVAVNCEAQSKWYIDSQNSDTADGFLLLGARASYAFQAAGHTFELNLSGRNLTDKAYMAFTEPDPDGNSYQPGPKREVFAGIRVGF